MDGNWRKNQSNSLYRKIVLYVNYSLLIFMYVSIMDIIRGLPIFLGFISLCFIIPFFLISKKLRIKYIAPDWRKVLLFIALSSLFLPFTFGCPGPSTRMIKIGGTCVFVTFFGLEYPELPQSSAEALYFPIFIISGILLYLFSCLLVLTYERLRKQKRNTH